MAVNLGHLERVDLRQVWRDEASEFTPWLAEAENLALLGRTVGMELEFEAQETNVGPFRADILAKDPLDDTWVLIENQIEKTDHRHLGQILTYSAGLKAKSVIWVAEKFTEEHRAALDWLNENTHDELRFFGLEVEAWRIGDSPIAPKFNVVSQPNDWSRQIRERTTDGELSDTRQMQMEFWTTFVENMDWSVSEIRPRVPRPKQWLGFSMGRSGFKFEAIASAWSGEKESYDTHELRVQLVISGKINAGLAFDSLQTERSAIESETGESLTWAPPGPEVSRARIYVRKTVDLNDRSRWPEYHRWLFEHLQGFAGSFKTRIQSLKL